MAADISFITPRANAVGAQAATSGPSGDGGAQDAFTAILAAMTGRAQGDRPSAGPRTPGDGSAPGAAGDDAAASAEAGDGEQPRTSADAQPGAGFVNTPDSPVRVGPDAVKTLPARIDEAALEPSASAPAAADLTGDAGAAATGAAAKAAGIEKSAGETAIAPPAANGEGEAAVGEPKPETGEPARQAGAETQAEAAIKGDSATGGPKTGDGDASSAAPTKETASVKPADASAGPSAPTERASGSAASGEVGAPASETARAQVSDAELANTAAVKADTAAKADSGAKAATDKATDAKAYSGAVEPELRALRRADARGEGRIGAHERARTAQGEASASDIHAERGAERRAARADLLSARGGDAAQPSSGEPRSAAAQAQTPAFANAQGALAPGVQTPAQAAPSVDPALMGEPAADVTREAAAEAARGERGEARADIARANTAAPHAASQRLAPQAAQTLAAQIARRAADGAKVFDIRLDPPELGRVEVKLEIRSGERVSAVLSAEKPEALAELQRSARDLERALNEAGLELEENGLSFQLSEGGDDAEREDAPREGAFQIALEGDEPGAGAARPGVVGPASYYGFTLNARTGVDVRV